VSAATGWLQRVQSGGMTSPDIHPLDPHDTEVGPHVLRSFAEFADASDDPAAKALAEYVLHMNTYEQAHILGMCTAIGTRQVTEGGKPAPREHFNDAIDALIAERDRLYPKGVSNE